MTSYHVFDCRLEVAQKGFGLMSLDLTVLDRFPPQEVVHLDCKDGRRAALILAAEITCSRDKLHINPGAHLISAVMLYISPQRHGLCDESSH